MIDPYYWSTPNGHKITLVRPALPMTGEAKRVLFGQTARPEHTAH